MMILRSRMKKNDDTPQRAKANNPAPKPISRQLATATMGHGYVVALRTGAGVFAG